MGVVIEDNEKLGRILKIQLEHEGYHVENIENGVKFSIKISII